jgi:hypothetical protein
MGLVASGKKKVKGLSEEEAKEYIRGQKRDNLPERIEKFVREKKEKRAESLPYNQGTFGISQAGVGARI